MTATIFRTKTRAVITRIDEAFDLADFLFGNIHVMEIILALAIIHTRNGCVVYGELTVQFQGHFQCVRQAGADRADVGDDGDGLSGMRYNITRQRCAMGLQLLTFCAVSLLRRW